MTQIKIISVLKARVYSLTAFIFALIVISSCSKQFDPLPKEVLSLKLDKKLLGKEAKDFLSRLHPGEVGSSKNEIGFYSGSRGGATIYVSIYENKIIALDEEKKMTTKISLGNTAFTIGEINYFDGLKIYKCFGYSQSHFIFSKDSNLYWLTADTEIDRKFLSAYLDYLNK